VSGPHLSLSLSREMWNEILRAALPFKLANGQFSLLGAVQGAARQLQVRERVAGLLEDRRAPVSLQRAGQRALDLWRDNRETVFGRLDELLHVEGTWRVEVDDLGTELVYGPQKVHADAWVRLVAEGKLTFLSEDLTVPFRIERRIGASLALGRIRFAPDKDAVIGNVQDLAVHIGDAAVLQILERLLESGIAQRLPSVEPVQVLRREQVEGLVGPLGGSLHVRMGVEDLQLDIEPEKMTLHVRFGFARMPESAQIPESAEEGA
jgi:hypothetical protein